MQAKRRSSRLLPLAATIAGMTLAPVSRADDFVCDATAALVTVDNQVIHGNVIALGPFACMLRGVQVMGEVILGDAGNVILNVCPGCGPNGENVRTDVHGGIRTQGTAWKLGVFGNSTLRGHVRLDDTFPFFGGATLICAAEIYGSVQLRDNETPIFVGTTNDDQGVGVGYCGSSGPTVHGTLQILGNRAPIDVSHTAMTGNLQCRDNDFPPTSIGGDVTVGGRAQGECAGF